MDDLERPLSLNVPSLSWRPRRGLTMFVVLAGVLTAFLYLPWWSTFPLLGLALLLGIPAMLLFTGLSVPREASVLAAHLVNRGGSDPDAVVRLSGGRVLWKYASSPLQLALLGGLLVISATGDLKLLGLVLALAGAIMFAASWLLSPWFRTRWCLEVASWCPSGYRESWMRRALAHDPGCSDVSNKRFEQSRRGLS